MSGSWNANVNFIQNGEKVDANITGRPDRALSDRTEYLKQRIDALDNGQAIFAFDVTVDSTVAVGNAVYWNSATQKFEKALAAVESDSQGRMINSKKSEVIGVVHSKASATVATLLLSGKASIDITAAVGESVTAGRYFLSGMTAGGLSKQQPGVSPAVLYADGNGLVYVQPQVKDLAENHSHYKIELYTTVAGVHDIPSPGERHVIISPDSSLPGWLPASHQVFQGLAPGNAAFGYNLSQHTELNRLWPPLPAEAASLVLFHGDLALGQELPTGPEGLVIVDRNGIWWMSDCYGDVPWDIGYRTSLSSSAAPSLGYPECPRDLTRKLTLYFSKVRYAAGLTAVTSLRPFNATTPIRVVDFDGNDAVSGDLKLKFDSSFLITSETATGSLVLKTLNGTNFTRGRVVEGVKAANGSVTITSTESRLDASLETVYQGIVTIEANIEGLERAIPPQVVRLIDVRERYESDIMYLGFPAAIQSSVRYKFKLPGSDGFPASAVLKLRLWLTGDATTGTFPTLTVSYRRIPRAVSATAIPSSDTALTFTTGMALTADYYIEKNSSTFAVSESDEVLFTVTRSATDGYAGEVGILDAVAVLSPAP